MVRGQGPILGSRLTSTAQLSPQFLQCPISAKQTGLLIDTVLKDCYVYYFTEMWLHNKIPDTAIQLDGQTLLCMDRIPMYAINTWEGDHVTTSIESGMIMLRSISLRVFT